MSHAQADGAGAVGEAAGAREAAPEAEAIAEREISSVRGPLFHRADIGTDAVIQKRVKHMQRLR